MTITLLMKLHSPVMNALSGALLLLTSHLTHAQETAYLPPADGYAGGSDWNTTDDPNATEWNHGNGSDEWEGMLGIEGGQPGGVELLEQDGTNFIRYQDARTAGGSGDNRKLAFTKTVFEAGDDPLAEDGPGLTMHFRTRLAVPSQGLPLEDVFEGAAWSETGDGTRVRFGGKGNVGIDTGAGTFGFALGSADADEALVNAAGDPASGLMINGAGASDNDGNLFEIPLENLADWQEFWVHIRPEAGETEDGQVTTHVVRLYHNGSLDPVEFAVFAGADNVGGAAEPALYFGHPATDQTGAFDLDFLHVSEGLIDPVPAQGSDPNVIVSKRSALGQVATVPSTHQGTIVIRNNGATKPLNLSNFAVGGPDRDHWTIDSQPVSVAAEGMETLTYTFDAKGRTGAFLGTITFATDDPDTASVTIQLSASVINTEGPVGHYPLDDSASADAPTLVDITGYDRPGTYVASEGAVTFGQTAIATGTAAAVSAGGSLQIPARPFGDVTNYTATFWVNVKTLPSPFGALFARATPSDTNPIVSLLLDSAGKLQWLVPNAGEQPLFGSETALGVNTNVHLAVVSTADHGEVSIYADGALIASGNGLDPATVDQSGIFFFGAFGPLGIDGVYDDLQIYDRALSAENIAFLAANPGDVLRAEDPDSDGDGLSDIQEAELGTNAVSADTDGDGLSDGDEVNVYKSNPTLADSDADGRPDNAEIAAGTDPNDPNSPGQTPTLTIVETGLGGTPAAAFILSEAFLDTALAFVDRAHVHKAAAFDSGSNTLSTTGDLIVPLPSYLIGQPYVKFANNARNLADYSATVTASEPVQWYLLLDNRTNGPEVSTSSPNTTDPELGGSLQWVLDGGWQRVNTGISPDGQGDYTGVDEGGEGGLNQFYAVYTLPVASTEVTVSNTGVGGNMISLVAVSAGVTPGILEPLQISRSSASVVLRVADGQTANLEYSLDLQQWAPVQSGVSGTYEDTDATRIGNAQGFYRGVQP